MNTKSKRLALLATVLACGIGNAAAAQPPPELGKILSYEEALDVDAAYLAKSGEVSKSEAMRRLRVQQHAGDISEKIRTRYADRLAGIYIEHEPASRLVVRLTGNDPVRPEFHQFDGDQLEVSYLTGAEHTFQDLQQRFEATFGALQARVPGLQGGYVDERTGEVVVEVVRGKVATSASTLASEAAVNFGVRTRVVELEEPTVQQAIFGGGDLDFQRGGQWYICTGAFVVHQPSTGRYGELTAGHCQPDSGVFDYIGHDGAFHLLTHVARQYSNIADIGWARRDPTVAVGPWFWANNQYRQLTGRRTRTSTNVGDQVCRFGRMGGYGCATVFSTSYNPGPICGPNVPGTGTCAATYVGLNSPVNLCQGGDSGGPWFISTVAAGVHTAGNPSAGLCVYTSTDYAYSHLALELLY